MTILKNDDIYLYDNVKRELYKLNENLDIETVYKNELKYRISTTKSNDYIVFYNQESASKVSVLLIKDSNDIEKINLNIDFKNGERIFGLYVKDNESK